MKSLFVLVLVVAALASSGCTYRHYKSPTNAEYTSISVGTSQATTGLELTADPASGLQTLKVGSHTNDQVEATGTLLGTAFKAYAKP